MLDPERQALIGQYGEGVRRLEAALHAHPFDAALAAVEAVHANIPPLIRRLAAQARERMRRHKTKGAYTATDGLRTYAVRLHDHAQQIAANIDAWHQRRRVAC